MMKKNKTTDYTFGRIKKRLDFWIPLFANHIPYTPKKINFDYWLKILENYNEKKTNK